jgi:hypothetical protein
MQGNARRVTAAGQNGLVLEGMDRLAAALPQSIDLELGSPFICNRHGRRMISSWQVERGDVSR